MLEVQAQADPDKLEATLEEVAAFRARVRHGTDGSGKYDVVAALVYLVNRCPQRVLDMTTPGGFGTRHVPLVWDVADDDAAAALDAVAGGAATWGMLFWVPLMRGGGEPATIAQWRDLALATVPEGRNRDGLGSVVLVFAELAGCEAAWRVGLRGWNMTESRVVNGWISEGQLAEAREGVLGILRKKFPQMDTGEVALLINQQDSLGLLRTWRDLAAIATTAEAFRDALRS